MAKRQADKQLTDRNCDDSDGEETPLNGSIKTASAEAISRRQIRALPGRNGGAKAPIGAPKLAPSNPTTFGQAFQSGKPASTNLFGIGRQISPDPPTSCLFDSPPPISTKPSSNSEKTKSARVQALTKYYASLRGLNLSVLRAFEDLTQKDAFMNLSQSFDHIKGKYDQYRRQIQSDLDLAESSTTQKDQVHSSSVNPPTTTTPFSFPTNRPDTSLEENKPAFENSSLVQTRSQPHSNDNSSKVSPFTVPNGSTAHDLKTGPTQNPFSMAAPSRPSPLRYENEDVPTGSLTQESSDATSKTNSNLFSMPDEKPAASLFSNRNADQNSKPEQKSAGISFAPTLPSTNVENKSPSVFGMPSTSSSSISVFGAEAPKPFSFVSPQTQSSVNKSPKIGFGFGVGGATNGSFFGGFGATRNNPTQDTPPKNAFNPVGFSFGNSPPTSTFSGKIPDPVASEKENIANPFTSTSNNDVDASADNVTTKPETSDALGITPAPPASNKGEEDEETLYETIARVYALMEKKQDDGNMAKVWVGWATCNVKLNRHKESKKTRILARSQVNQNILVNFFLRPDLKPENRGNSLEVVGFNTAGTELQAYRFRPASEQAVGEFLNAIKQVVASL